MTMPEAEKLRSDGNRLVPTPEGVNTFLVKIPQQAADFGQWITGALEAGTHTYDATACTINTPSPAGTNK